MVDDPQAHAIGAFVDVPGRGDDAPQRAVATPIRFGSTDVGPSGPVPELGEHGRDVLRELGYDEAQIRRLTGERPGGAG